MKDVVTYALEQHQEADPNLLLWDLPEQLQVLLISKNMTAALQAKRFGRLRSPGDRLRDGLAVAQDITRGRINAGKAIETGGNPGPDTVADLMKLVGVTKPWNEIAKYFDAIYEPPASPELAGIAVGDLQERLRELVGLRNVVAHSGARIPSSPAEIRFDVHFTRHLAAAIHHVLKEHVDAYVRSVGRIPGAWAL
ncbi:hypothetical protein GCM10018987_24130 [Streptomyces cremeus]